MRSLNRSVFLGFTCIAVSGCQTWNTLESQARVDPRSIAHYRSAGGTLTLSTTCDKSTRLRGDAYDVAIDLDCFRFPSATPAQPGELAYSLAAQDDGSRNRLASILMKHSDDICTKELGDLSAREAITNTALGIATSVLKTVSSVVTGNNVKSWLSGGAAVTNATRDHVNAEVFRNVLTSAMAKAIGNERLILRDAMLAKFGTGRAAYPVDQMIMEVTQYHQNCSFYNGLVLVVDAVNRASPSIAGAYRDKSAAIADLDVRIAEMERRAAGAAKDSAEAKLYLKTLGEVIEQRNKLDIERSKLGSSPAAAAAK